MMIMLMMRLAIPATRRNVYADQHRLPQTGDFSVRSPKLHNILPSEQESSRFLPLVGEFDKINVCIREGEAPNFGYMCGLLGDNDSQHVRAQKAGLILFSCFKTPPFQTQRLNSGQISDQEKSCGADVPSRTVLKN